MEINQSKTEEFKLKQIGGEEWKKCKILGSLIGTEEDINKRRHQQKKTSAEGRHQQKKTPADGRY